MRKNGGVTPLNQGYSYTHNSTACAAPIFWEKRTTFVELNYSYREIEKVKIV